MRESRRVSILSLASLVAVLFPLSFEAQDIPGTVPDSLKSQVFSVHFHAVIPQYAVADGQSVPSQQMANGAAQGGEKVAWEEEGSNNTVLGTPSSFKLVASNLVVLFHVTPFENRSGGITLVAQGQVWFRRADGGLSYKTSLNTVDILFGEAILFYPLGVEPDGRAPLRLEISVSKLPPTSGGPQPAPAVSGNDKTGK